MRVDIPRTTKKLQTSGCWWDSGARICIKCPECDLIAGLDHEVKENGNVEPSLDCPSCNFHRYVRLLNWS